MNPAPRTEVRPGTAVPYPVVPARVVVPPRQGQQPPQPDGRHATDLLRTAVHARVRYRHTFDGTDPDLVRVPGAATAELIQDLSARVERQVEQIIPVSPGARPRNAFANLTWWALAATGRTCVSRLYLAPPGGLCAGDVRRLVEADRHHAVHAEAVAVTDAVDEARLPASRIPTADMWIIDDAIVVREVSVPGGSEWHVSRRPEDLAEARAVLAGLRRAVGASPPAAAPDRPAGLGEALLRSADTMRAIAEICCTRSYVDRACCAWYHGAWPYLRLCNMVSSPDWHAAFYLGHLRQEINDFERRRILISGMADYSMLAYLADAAEHPDDLDVHAVDQCQTPLLGCGWFARRQGISITTRHTDILTMDRRPAGGFDLIVTDAFLTRFSPATAERVVRTWSSLLAPSGVVVTTVRLHPGDDADATPAGADNEVTNFALRFRERMARYERICRVGLDELQEAAHRYAVRMTSRNLGDEDDVKRLFERAGMAVKCCERETVPGELHPTTYLRMVTQKGDH